MHNKLFLPDVPIEYILKRLNSAAGNELESGKLASPQSSAALAVNAFGWFINRPKLMVDLPQLQNVDWPAVRVDIEYEARFPWRGGRHPWLDAVIETKSHLIGIESKRFEPFRDTKNTTFRSPYWREVWGDKMVPYENMRDALSTKKIRYKHLDAAQLVKHAFGLRTQANKRGLKPILVYIFVETIVEKPVKVRQSMVDLHRLEINDFANRVEGAEISFHAFSYSEWLATLTENAAEHAIRLTNMFNL
jgi:Restriction Endonuclease associating with ARP